MENTPDQLVRAIRSGYDVEIDVWSIDDEFFLGHDGPDLALEKSHEWLLSFPGSWVHAKNDSALRKLLDIPGVNCFAHDRDPCALTSAGYIWGFPSCTPTDKSICVMPEVFSGNPWYLFGGVCTDDPDGLREESGSMLDVDVEDNTERYNSLVDEIVGT